MESTTEGYFNYWGKLAKEPGQTNHHLLVYHSLDVAAVCQLLLEHDQPLCQDLAQLLGIEPKNLQQLFTYCVALHDLGKFATAFQRLGPELYPETYQRSRRMQSYDGANFRHDRLGYSFWHALKNGSGGLPKEWHETLDIFMECTLGHHGKPVDTTERSRTTKRFTKAENIEAATNFARDSASLLLSDSIKLPDNLGIEWRNRVRQSSWHLAGLAVLADWVGSDHSDFPYCTKPMPLQKYWERALQQAEQALAKRDLARNHQVKPFVSFTQHFGFRPSPLQKLAESVAVDDSPQLFILEDVTGSGKTEAALTLTHRLMKAGAASGFYFGLPSMATANAMFDRIAAHYLTMLGNDTQPKPSIVLAHNASKMSEHFREAVLAHNPDDKPYQGDDDTASAECHQWLADSRKKALLAPVGVGTIDQALLAVLPRRHQSLRLLGLHRKVLIFDEVHSADSYMFQLLESLLTLHLHQGGSAVLLTATLSQHQRARLVKIWQQAAHSAPQLPKKADFPLATRVSLTAANPVLEQPLTSRADVSREVGVQFEHTFDGCIEHVLQAANGGKCVVWVRNSVDDAIEAHQAVSQQLDDPQDCLLFHSRFILLDRKRTETQVLNIFGKSACSKNRTGKVLIATQVFQESLDADCDVMLSDLCPIDDLIQRAGRLHRHTRDANGQYHCGITDTRQPPQLIVHAPQWDPNPPSAWLGQAFRNTGFVYQSPGRLWLAMGILRQLGAIRMPAEARTLIEAVYGEECREQIPPALQKAEQELYAAERNKGSIARHGSLNWQAGYNSESNPAWFDDDTEISTRFSDQETVSVVLLKQNSFGELAPYVEDDKFALELSTVKLGKRRFADQLKPIPDALLPALEMLTQRYRGLKYLQCWLPELDSGFEYSVERGFCVAEIE